MQLHCFCDAQGQQLSLGMPRGRGCCCLLLSLHFRTSHPRCAWGGSWRGWHSLLSLGGAPGGAGPALVWLPLLPVGLPPPSPADAALGGATPGRGLATRSPVDDVQVVQVIQRVQHLAQHVLQPLGRKRRQDGGPESTHPSQAAWGRSVQPMGSGPFPIVGPDGPEASGRHLRASAGTSAAGCVGTLRTARPCQLQGPGFQLYLHPTPRGYQRC